MNFKVLSEFTEHDTQKNESKSILKDTLEKESGPSISFS